MFSPTLSGCHVETSNVIIHVASCLVLCDLPDQIRSAAGGVLYCRFCLYSYLGNSFMVHLVMSVLINLGEELRAASNVRSFDVNGTIRGGTAKMFLHCSLP